MTTTAAKADPELVKLASDFFGARSTFELVEQAEKDGLPRELWREIEELGISRLAADDADASQGTVLDLVAVLHHAAAHAAPIPLAETSLAAWALTRAGLEVPDGPLTVAVPADPPDARLDGNLLSGAFPAVPWARSAQAIVAVLPRPDGSCAVAVVSPDTCRLRHGTDLAGQPRDDVTVETEALAVAVGRLRFDAFLRRGALLRSAQIAGALEAVALLTRRYTADRVQFGKPLAAFQAVQHHLVALEQAATLTKLTVDRAAAAVRIDEAEFEIWALKLVANQNARLAARAAHQAHGAIGMTREYPLQQLTRRLNTWRADNGTDRELSARLGALTAGRSFHDLVTRNPTEGGNDVR